MMVMMGTFSWTAAAGGWVAVLMLGAWLPTAAAQLPGVSAKLSATPPYTCTLNYYVDSVTGNDSNPGTQAAPWKTIANANNGYPNVPKPGECVNVAPGVYPLTAPLVLSRGGNLNTPTGFVVYRSTVPQGATILASPGLPAGSDMIAVWAAYIVIDGFVISGNHALTSGHAIDGCTGGGQPMNIAHHLTVINNVIHDIGGAGVNTCTADYVTLEHNTIFNTSSSSPYQVSAIDIWEPKALAPGSFTPTAADSVPFGIVISYNRVFNNAEGPAIPGNHTDGNGIIIDTTLGSATCPTCGVPYAGNILVLGNASYNNGGGGIHVFLSENVTVANNTVYNNYLDPQNNGTARGELSNGGSANITWINNIAFAVPGSGVFSHNTPMVTFPVGQFLDSGTWTKNIMYGAPVTSDSRSYVDPAQNYIGVNPELANPALGRFAPLPGSPALRTGQPESYVPQPVPDIGAY
jgi:parallel beta-helix repeat protein